MKQSNEYLLVILILLAALFVAACNGTTNGTPTVDWNADKDKDGFSDIKEAATRCNPVLSNATAMSGGGYTLAGGFWGDQYRIYLPLVMMGF